MYNVAQDQNNINNFALLQKAITSSRQYTPKQRDILNLFLNIEVNDLVQITPLELTESLNTSRATVYLGLSRLEEDGLIQNLSQKGRHFNVYRLNKTKLNDFLTVYQKKQSFLKKTDKFT